MAAWQGLLEALIAEQVPLITPKVGSCEMVKKPTTLLARALSSSRKVACHAVHTRDHDDNRFDERVCCLGFRRTG